MHDLMPADLPQWHRLERETRKVFELYGFEELRTPILEQEEIFVRSVGESTDIVSKELFKIADTSSSPLCMRPEGTVPTVRAAANAGLLRGGGITRIWYDGPMFRRERPQQGRLRQFHQFGAEALGDASGQTDVEMILLCKRLWESLAIVDKVVLEINNLGVASERAKYRQQLTEHFHAAATKLSETDQRRLAENPLRLLDSKDQAAQALLEKAPDIDSCLGEESRQHFEKVKKALDAAGVPYEINPWLVRGLDYYNLTVFEWVVAGSDKRMNALAGGGRYDGLLEQLNGNSCPGVGMAAGKERIIALLDDAPQADDGLYVGMSSDIYDGEYLMELCERLRGQGFSVISHGMPCKIPALLKHASASIARYAVIVGKRELAEQTITVKPLRESKEQFSLPFDESVECLRNDAAN